MESFLRFVQQILTGEIGSLAYHLILLFCIIGSLQIGFGFLKDRTSNGKRLILGFSILFLFQLVLFAIVSFIWQGLLNANKWLPFLERTVSMFSVLVVVWLWVFPHHSRSTDSAVLILGLLVLTLSLLFGIWWVGQPFGQAFNGSLADRGQCFATVALLGCGMLGLLIRRPLSWGSGFGMMLILLVGYLFHLVFPQELTQFSISIRLAEIAAYPLLFSFVNRLVEQTPRIETSSTESKERSTLRLFEELLGCSEQSEAFHKITRFIAVEFGADLCLLTATSKPGEPLKVLCVFDNKNNQFLDISPIDQQAIPVLVAAMHQSRVLRLPVTSTAPDLGNLAKCLNLDSVGNLLYVPLPNNSNENTSTHGLILLTPHSLKSWSQEEAQQMIEFALPMAQFLHQLDKMAEMQAEMQQTKAELENLRTNLGKIKQLVEELKTENEQLRQALNEQISLATLAPPEISNGEYQRAMAELSLIKQSIMDNERELLAIESGLFSDDQPIDINQKIECFTREMFKAMTSIHASTSFLLVESIGPLGSLQRQLLERIGLVTEQIKRLIEAFIVINKKERVDSEQ